MGHTVREFNLEQVHNTFDTIPPREPDVPLLDLNDLQSCIIFYNLGCMNLDLQWDVDLSNDGLLTLASAWPQREELFINANWCWSRSGGITPNRLTSRLRHVHL